MTTALDAILDAKTEQLSLDDLLAIIEGENRAIIPPSDVAAGAERASIPLAGTELEMIMTGGDVSVAENRASVPPSRPPAGANGDVPQAEIGPLSHCEVAARCRTERGLKPGRPCGWQGAGTVRACKWRERLLGQKN